MPSHTYIQLISILLFHSWKSDGTIPVYPYDDPDVNAKLGIKRDHGTTARNDYPVKILANDRPSFSDYISACNNGTLEQIKDRSVGSVNGYRIWKKFCTDVVFKALNREIERQLMEAEIHPQQLLEETEDEWRNSDFSYQAQVIGRIVAHEIFGETVTVNSSSLIHSMAGSLVDSAVVHNLDRLRRTHARAEKKLPESQKNLDAAMKSKHHCIRSIRKLTTLVELNDEENITLADIQRAIKELEKFNKKTAFMPNARSAAAVHQSTIESLLTKLGKEEKGVAIKEKHRTAGGYLLMHLRRYALLTTLFSGECEKAGIAEKDH